MLLCVFSLSMLGLFLLLQTLLAVSLASSGVPVFVMMPLTAGWYHGLSCSLLWQQTAICPNPLISSVNSDASLYEPSQTYQQLQVETLVIV